MKTKAQKQKDLEALTEQFQNAKAAMLVGFQKMTVAKDQELRNQLREAGVSYEVVKNTLARRASEGTALEPAAEHFKGVTAVALSNGDPVGLSKAISKFTKANPDVFTFKARSEEHTSELQSPCNLVCRLLLEKKKNKIYHIS